MRGKEGQKNRKKVCDGEIVNRERKEFRRWGGERESERKKRRINGEKPEGKKRKE